MEAEGGIEPPYTALQAVDLRLFLHIISGLHRKSGNPLLRPTPRERGTFSTPLFSTQPNRFDGCQQGPMLMLILECHTNCHSRTTTAEK